MPDKNIECVDCKRSFVFTESEQKFFREKNFSDPKRCPACRQKRRQEKNARRGQENA